MGPFVKRGWGNNPGASTGAQQTGGQGNGTWDGRKYIFPDHAQYMEDGSLRVRINGFLATLRNERTGDVIVSKKTGKPCFGDDITLNKMDPSVFSIVRDKDLDYIEIKPGKLDDFKKLLPNILNFLAGTNHYKDQAINKFADSFDEVLERTPTKEEIEANTKVIVSNWKELLDALKDPETRKKFLLFQTTYTCKSIFSHSVLSPGNISEVLMKDPNASFVTDAPTWFSEFDRTIIPGHEKDYIIISKPDAKFPDTGDLDAVLSDWGYPQGYWKVKADPKLKQIAYSAVKKVTIDKHLARGFYDTKVYDVRFTMPRDPNNDKFLQVANLINNLTGELNDAAKAQMKADAIAKGESEPDFDAKKVGIEDNEGLLKYKKTILTKCKSKGIKIAEVGTTQDIIANGIYAYAEKCAEELNILKPENKAYFASAILCSLSLMYGMDSAKASSCAHVFDKLSDTEKEEMIQKAFPILKSLKIGIAESVGDITFQEFREMVLGFSTNRNSIKKKFDEINERLNNVKF